MATLHINEKVCARNCKKNTTVQLTGLASLSKVLHRGQGKPGTSLAEGAAFSHILQHAINEATAVKASKGQICCWHQSAMGEGRYFSSCLKYP